MERGRVHSVLVGWNSVRGFFLRLDERASHKVYKILKVLVYEMF